MRILRMRMVSDRVGTEKNALRMEGNRCLYVTVKWLIVQCLCQNENIKAMTIVV